jgi:hypothetical protein
VVINELRRWQSLHLHIMTLSWTKKPQEGVDDDDGGTEEGETKV